MTSFALLSQTVDSSIVQNFQLPEAERQIYYNYYPPQVFVDPSSQLSNGAITLSEFHSGVMMVIPLDQEPPYLPIFIDSSGLARNGWNFSWSEYRGRLFGTHSGVTTTTVFEVDTDLKRTNNQHPAWEGDPHYSGFTGSGYISSRPGTYFIEDNIGYWSETLMLLDTLTNKEVILLDSYTDFGLSSYSTDARYCWIDQYTDSTLMDNTHANSWSYHRVGSDTIASAGYRHAGVGVKINSNTYFVGGTDNTANRFSWKNSKGFAPPHRWATHSMKVEWVSAGLDSVLIVGLRNANCEDSVTRVDYVLLDLNGMKADIIQQFTPTELVFAHALGNVQLILSTPFEQRTKAEVLNAPILVNFGEGPGAVTHGGSVRYGFFWDATKSRGGFVPQFLMVTPQSNGTWHANMLGDMGYTGASYQMDYYSYAENPRLKTLIDELRRFEINCQGAGTFDLPGNNWAWEFDAPSTSYTINPNNVYDDPVVLQAYGKPYAGGTGYVISHKLASDCATTDINELSDNTSLSIYPNPTLGKLVIDGVEIKEVKVMNLTGQIVPMSDQNVIDLSALADGVYLLQVTTTNGINTISKVVKGR